jgi:hypothetical protein
MAFRTTTRRSLLINLGISDSELRGPLWRRATHGHYYFALNDPEDPMRPIHDAIGFMPKDGAISGWAAAFLSGVRELDGRRWSDGRRDPVLLVLPKPAVNVAVLDSYGAFAGIPDLLDEASGLVGEYDGGQHRELVQHTNDNAREERLESLGLVVVRATSVDLKSRRKQLVARLRRGYQRARGQHRRSWQI